MANFLFPTAGKLTAGALLQAPYATGIMKLFSSAIQFTPTTSQADLVAIEATFTGYAAITLVALPPLYIDGVNNGVAWTIPTQQWNTSSPTLVGNSIYGGWIETSGHVLLQAWQVQTPIPMLAPSDSLALEWTMSWFGDAVGRLTVNGIAM